MVRGPLDSVGCWKLVSVVSVVPVTLYSVLRMPLMLSRLNRLNASQINCSLARPTGRSRATRGANDTWDGRRDWVRVVPGAMSLRAFWALLMALLTEAEEGWPDPARRIAANGQPPPSLP